ncbi:lipocalin-like domain-containing protein [Agromyces bracchium]|uniref:Hydroxyneurosporene dehydrogenase n=1 Tax=Agromyces bracchium TaxID=88376 RepID=A0A6I3M1R2_9MICO|nr:lipocalin-like domain-containing protein [Agromyces bracchium]MTH67095.1 hydroxyneurosporene dehydrogenase [Agromyces bracchium]
MRTDPAASAAGNPDDYRRFGLDPRSIEPWEDGARTENRPGTYEWWYFDAHLDDGSKLVVVFQNKDAVSPNRPLSPLLRINLDLPDGRTIEKLQSLPADSWSAATDHCDVRVGADRFEGDLHTYRITAAVDEVAIEVTLTGDIPPWRPGTGHLVFGADRADVFAWLPSVPQGTVTGTLTLDGATRAISGVGYHDHNWGNVPLPSIVHDWYWARGQAGPYSVIASYITAVEKLGFQAIPVFMLARDGEIVADDASRVRFETDDVFTDGVTGKPVASVVRYTYADGDDEIVVEFTRERDLVRARMADELSPVKRLLARLARFDGAYLRFAGPITVTVRRGGALVERHGDEAIWELMYFGRARAIPVQGATSA